MKTIYCSNQERVVLSDYLSQAQPIVLAAEPFAGELIFQMELPSTTPSPYLCFHLTKRPRSSTTPHWADRVEEIPECFLLFTKCQTGYAVHICLSHKDVIVRMSGGADLTIQVRCLSGNSKLCKQARPVILCVQGEEFFQTVNLAMRLAIALVGGKGKLAEEKPSLPEWLNTLGWESGASFGREVTHDKVLNAVWSLRDSGVQPGYVIIDEGWQEATSTFGEKKKENLAMRSFEADPGRFPYGLKGLVDELQRAGVGHIGVWHAMMGFRGGIQSHLALAYGLLPDSNGRYFLGYDLGKTFQFYYDFYGYLRDQGVSFVKVGAQNQAAELCVPGMDITRIHQNLQAAIQAAASIQFDTPPFNTECLRNENLFYWTTSRLASAGDPWDVQNPSTCKKGIRNLLANSIWLQHLMRPDYNPWLTSVTDGEQLGVLHALSSSTVIISDPPGKNREEISKKVVLPSGKLLKAARPLSLCPESVFIDPLKNGKICKAYTYKGSCGILAAFNLHEGGMTLNGKIFPNDVPGILGDRFAAFSHLRGFVGVFNMGQGMEITLIPGQCDVITFSPIELGIAVIGASDFFLSSGPILDTTIEEESVHISSQVTAPMTIYCERQVLEIRRNGEVVAWEYDNQLNILTFDTNASLTEIAAMYTITFE